MVVGRMLTERTLNVKALKQNMSQARMLVGKVIIRAIRSNLFVFQFFHWCDKEKVMSGRRWCFGYSLLILNDIMGNEQLAR